MPVEDDQSRAEDVTGRDDAPETQATRELTAAIQRLITAAAGVSANEDALDDILSDMVDAIEGEVEVAGEPEEDGKPTSMVYPVPGNTVLTKKQVDALFQSELQAYRRGLAADAPENKKILGRLRRAHRDMYYQFSWGTGVEATTAWRKLSQDSTDPGEAPPKGAEDTEEVRESEGGRKRRTRASRTRKGGKRLKRTTRRSRRM
jgi:hypothetical protein